MGTHHHTLYQDNKASPGVREVSTSGATFQETDSEKACHLSTCLCLSCASFSPGHGRSPAALTTCWEGTVEKASSAWDSWTDGNGWEEASQVRGLQWLSPSTQRGFWVSLRHRSVFRFSGVRSLAECRGVGQVPVVGIGFGWTLYEEWRSSEAAPFMVFMVKGYPSRPGLASPKVFKTSPWLVLER